MNCNLIKTISAEILQKDCQIATIAQQAGKDIPHKKHSDIRYSRNKMNSISYIFFSKKLLMIVEMEKKTLTDIHKIKSTVLYIAHSK